MAGVFYGSAAGVRGLRDVGNGGNDTAGSYGFVINSEPDTTILGEAQVNPDPMYPKIDVSDERSLLSHKGLHAFIDVTWKHNSTSEFRSDIDKIKYIDDLAGQYSSNMEPWQLVNRLAYVGVVRNDVLREKGAAKDNTLDWSAKRTSRNTGNKPLMAGQYVYWDIPPKAQNRGEAEPSRGAAQMADMPANANPIWTMPYDPILHKGSPGLIKRALAVFPAEAGDEDAGRFKDPRFPDHALHRHSNELVDALIRTSIVLLASMAGPQGMKQATTPEVLIGRMFSMIKEKNNKERVNFLAAYLDPLGGATNLQALGQSNFIFKSEAALPKLQDDPEHNRKVNVTGTVFEPNSHVYRTMWGEKSDGFEGFSLTSSFDSSQSAKKFTPEQEVTICQLTAAEDTFYFTALVNGFYTNRVIEVPITSADPGKDYDSVPTRIIGPS